MSCSRAPQTAGDAAAEVGAGGRASHEQAPDDSHLAHVCADVKTGEGGYVELAIIMSMIAHQRLRGGRFLGEGAGGGVDQDHRAEDDVPAHRRRSEDYEGRAETSQTSRRCARAQTIQCGGVCATQLGSDLTTYMLEMARTTTTTQQ